MKKSIILNFGAIALLIITSISTTAQAVRDRNVIPVAVNLNEVLRLSVTNGGNIEFAFNTIKDYEFGLSGDAAGLQNPADVEIAAGGTQAANVAATQGFYRTDFKVAASVRWKVLFGAEQATFIGTDNPGNTLDLDNVGFSLLETGNHNFEADGAAQGTDATKELFSSKTNNGNSVTALQQYPNITLIEDNNATALANAGDETENAFTIVWRCGTTEAGQANATNANVAMEAVSLLNQGDLDPDRYVTNVFLDLERDF